MTKGEELNSMKKRMEELEPIITKSFKTSKELNEYYQKNKNLYDEGEDLYKKIEELEWETMSPEEKERHKKVDKFLELKAKGKPFDLDEFA